ncbi:MAG: hypothetical protein PHI01_05120, partial [Candidatus Izemoplasmatales bacterium]|nr:hypothetical protein [Candidatus Izemoplasmatales bacterium]
GIGIAGGENRAIEAARAAIRSPLLETSINGATDAIVNITSGFDASLYEINEIIEEIQKSSTTDINVIYGSAINSDLDDEIIVTVIATGFSEDPLFKDYTLERAAEVPESPEGPLKDQPRFETADRKLSKQEKKDQKKKQKAGKEQIPLDKPESESEDDIQIPSWLKERFKK